MGAIFSNSWKLFALGSAFFAALTAILGKIGVSGLNSNLATFIRTTVILLMTAGVLSVRREWSWGENRLTQNIAPLVASGICTGLSWLCYYRALQLGPVSKVASLDKLSLALAIGFAFLFLGEQITVHIAMGALLILAGTILIIL